MAIIGKFLLQFLEPLAIVGLFLFISLFIVRSKAKGALFFMIVALIMIVLFGNVFFSNWLTRSMEWRHMPVNVSTTKADAIVLLADGTYPSETPRLRVEVGEAADRVLYATALFQRGAAQGILVVGTVEQTEASKQLLLELGVPENAIFLNQTTGNIVDLVTSTTGALSVVNAEKILLVSSALEMDRMRFAFEQSGLEIIPAPCDYHVTKASWDALSTAGIKDVLIRIMPTSESFSRTVSTLGEYFSLAFYRIKAIL